MQQRQDIVPVTLKSEVQEKKLPPQESFKTVNPKVALQVKRDNMDITIYNGCNNYILNAALGVFNSHAN